MRRTASQGGCWPTPEQILLLRAALHAGPSALDAFRAWRGRVNLDRLDRGSCRLLPLLGANLRRHDVRDSLVASLAELSAETRAKNLELLSVLAGVLTAFSEAGLDTLVLKGAALLTLYYADPGLRPMSDLDLLVPTDSALPVIGLLRQLGWQPLLPAVERVVPVTHSHLFRDAAGRRLDLHWHVLWDCCGPKADDDFWKAAVTTTIEGVPTLALCHADQLLHACVHGLAWNPVPPLRWAADAMLILERGGPGLAWDRLVTQARRLKLILPLRAAFAFLRDTLEAAIPDAVLSALQTSPVSRLERLDYRARMRPWGRTGALSRMVCHYLRLSDALEQPWTPLGFARYLQRVHGLDRLLDLPPALLARLVRRA